MGSNEVTAIAGVLTTSAFIAAVMVLSMFYLVVRLSNAVALLESMIRQPQQAPQSQPQAPVPEPPPPPLARLSDEELRVHGEAMLRALSEDEELEIEERERGIHHGTTSRNVCGAWDAQDEREAALEEIERARKGMHD